ncbi:hypothetical protein E2C06_15690 [Dankookia rubra]|uniref:Uncharacterized protein n=1 Tax=Dankookia rubra TaxID=1442381 RepID=A0A4R5QF04_9PROT|nr:hypothetical protein [Dankookia rubra]TDH61576.1 hypothetical protein E2C06_15690 [Dankookia rubra]
MDAAIAAGMSDPALNPHFRRCWHQPQDASRSLTVFKATDPLTAMGQALQNAWLRKRQTDKRRSP